MNSAPTPPWVEKFSQREIEILDLIAEGYSNREISQHLHLSLDTVKWYNKRTYVKLGVSSRTQALKEARQYGLLGSQGDGQEAEKLPKGTRVTAETNLPAQLTSYVGRERESTEIQSLLATSRLVTLTGAGGSGKTRLALQVAGALSPDYGHGVWLVELAPLNDPALVVDAIARVLKVKANSDAATIEALKRSMARKQVLLILDSCEHLLAAVPQVVELLAAAPQLSILATSRERLHIYGEVEYPVQPLSLPDLAEGEAPHELLAYEAVDLFIQRAQAALPALETDDENLTAAAHICAHLDGLPLAIELAASQVKIFPPIVLTQRLEDSLKSLPRGPRDLPARQRTLRATIEWSYNLLEEAEKRLLARLAVFNGGGDLDAIQHICDQGLADDLLEVLTALVDKNLVVVREGLYGQPHFTMLALIGEYALEQLLAFGEAETIRQLHADYYVSLAEQFSREIRSPAHKFWNARMQAEAGNLRTVLRWSFAGTENHYGLRMVAALHDYWYYNSTAQDAHWAELAQKVMVGASPDLRAAVLNSVGTLYHNLGDMARVGKLHRQAAELFQQLGDERNAAWSNMLLSIANSEDLDDIENSVDIAKHSLGVLRRFEDKPGIARALTILGELARMGGDYTTAKSYYAESLALSQEVGERIREAIQYSNLGIIAYHQGQHRLAVNYFQQSLTILEELDIHPVNELQSLAGPTAALGYPLRAARLIGAAEGVLEITGIDPQPPDLQDIQPIIETVRQTLGEQAYQGAWQAGYALTTQQAFALALSDFDSDE